MNVQDFLTKGVKTPQQIAAQFYREVKALITSWGEALQAQEMLRGDVEGLAQHLAEMARLNLLLDLNGHSTDAVVEIAAQLSTHLSAYSQILQQICVDTQAVVAVDDLITDDEVVYQVSRIEPDTEHVYIAYGRRQLKSKGFSVREYPLTPGDLERFHAVAVETSAE